jgi:hypothetical protein
MPIDPGAIDIEMRSPVVEDQGRRVLEKSASDRDAPALAGRKMDAAITEDAEER